MIDTATAARLLLAQYADTLRTMRADHRISIRDLAAATGVPASTISQIETCKRIPTEAEAEVIHDWIVHHTHHHLFDTDRYRHLEVSARATDPTQSHDTVRSISADGTIADRITEIAADYWPAPFDDTDLRDEFQRRWPRGEGRPWQRNVIAKARIDLHSRLVRTSNGGDRRTVRLESSEMVLKRAGSAARPDRGQTRPTDHFIYNKTTGEES